MGLFKNILLATDGVSIIPQAVRAWLEPTLMILMAVLGVATIIVVLIQKGTSDNIGAIAGDTETFMGKNKGSTLERKLKITTVVCMVLLLVVSVVYFIITGI